MMFINRQRSALGECLAAFSGAFPVAFLETHLNKHNIYSIYNTKNARDRAGIFRISCDAYENTNFTMNASFLSKCICIEFVVQEFYFILLIAFYFHK